MLHIENGKVGKIFQRRNILIVQIADNGQFGNGSFIIVRQQLRQRARSLYCNGFAIE